MITFEIGQREDGFYSARTDTQTDTPSSALVYIFNQENIRIDASQILALSALYPETFEYFLSFML